MVEEYATKPEVVQAVKFDGTNFDEVKQFASPHGEVMMTGIDGEPEPNLYVWDRKVARLVSPGYYVVRDHAGKFYVTPPSLFAETYDRYYG